MAQLKTVVVDYIALKTSVEKLFRCWGFSDKESADITDVLVRSNLSGISSHGIQRLSIYETLVATGNVQVKNHPKIVTETPVMAVVHGNQAMGQLVALFAMEQAIKKAKKNGIGLVVVRDSNHFGIAGYYAELAARENLLGISMTNSIAVMPATFGVVPLIGTNPVAFAFPGEPYPFLYDASSTVVSLGKIEVAEKSGQVLPAPWGLDQCGNPSVQPSEILEDFGKRNIGGVLPLGGAGEENGGYKGYGQGLIVEILTAILSGGTTSSEISSLETSGACHFFLAIDPGLFGSVESMKERLQHYFARLRSSNLTDQKQRVYIHGEKEFEKRERYLREGIPIEKEIWEEFEKLCGKNRVEAPKVGDK
ncbi:Ldh family oxidoreductase [Lachnospiraceae bacterium ZAX-1]